MKTNELKKHKLTLELCYIAIIISHQLINIIAKSSELMNLSYF